eukprot:2167649-Rhodomonas_salina.2
MQCAVPRLGMLKYVVCSVQYGEEVLRKNMLVLQGLTFVLCGVLYWDRASWYSMGCAVLREGMLAPGAQAEARYATRLGWCSRLGAAAARGYEPPIGLRLSYAVSGTEIGLCYEMSGTETDLCYEMSGTEIGDASRRGTTRTQARGKAGRARSVSGSAHAIFL